MNKQHNKEIRTVEGASEVEIDNKNQFLDLYKNSPIPEKEILSNIGLFLSRQTLSRIIFMHEIYTKIIPVHGVVMEFGVRWGQNLALFSAFRGMHEPFNYSRKVIGFDTFSGFPEVDKKDGLDVKIGDYSVSENYECYLEKVLSAHELESPIAHKKKFELIKGDATITVDSYLTKHPETIIALVYFDFDIYLPTKKCLEFIKPYLTKGSVIAFDELNYDKFPGETVALREVFGLDKYRIQRSPLNPLCSYIVIE